MLTCDAGRTERALPERVGAQRSRGRRRLGGRGGLGGRDSEALRGPGGHRRRHRARRIGAAEGADADVLRPRDRLAGVLSGRRVLVGLVERLLVARRLRLGPRQLEHREGDLIDQPLDDLIRVARPLARRLLEAALDQLDDPLGDLVALGQVTCQGRGLLVHVLVEDRRVVVGGEGHHPREHVIEENSDRVHVDALVELLALDLLRGEAGGRPEHVLLGDVRRARHQLREAEVEDLDVVRPALPLAEHEVGGLDVAVDDPPRVGLTEPLEHLRRDRHEVRQAEPLAALDEALEGLPGDVLHDDVRPAVEGSVVVDRDDIGVLKRAQPPGLSLEARERLRVADPVRGQHLEHNLAVGVGLARLVDHAHSASAEATLDQIAAGEDRADQGILLLRPFVARRHRDSSVGGAEADLDAGLDAITAWSIPCESSVQRGSSSAAAGP